MKRTKATLLLLTCGTNACYHIAKRLKELFGEKFRIVGTDINKRWMIPTQPYLDAFYQCPRTDSENYKEFILGICDKEKVDYLMPSFDADQMLFHQGDKDLKQRGIISLGISQAVTAIYHSKKETNRYLEKHSLPVPKFYQKDEVEDEKTYFCKPKKGVGSIGVKKLTGREIKGENDEDFIIEEICYYPEITLECFNYGGKVYSVARERLDAKAGVCTKARVFKDDELQAVAQRFAESIELPYIFNLQFMSNSEGEKVITDVNLRTAGGMSLSCAAGWDEAAALGKIMLGEDDVTDILQPPEKDIFVMRAYIDIVTKTCKRKIAFDLDGTLLDSRMRHKKVMDTLLKDKGIHIDTSDLTTYKADGHNNLDWLKKNGIEEPLAADINKLWIALIEEESYLADDNLYESAELVLSEMSKSNALYLITARNNNQNAEQQVLRLGLRPYFDGVYVVASSKQTSEDKAAILKKLGINLYIGDTESDYKASQIAGCRFVATTFGFRSSSYWVKFDNSIETIDNIEKFLEL